MYIGMYRNIFIYIYMYTIYIYIYLSLKYILWYAYLSTDVHTGIIIYTHLYIDLSEEFIQRSVCWSSSQVRILGFWRSRATAGQGVLCVLGGLHHWKEWKMERHLFLNGHEQSFNVRNGQITTWILFCCCILFVLDHPNEFESSKCWSPDDQETNFRMTSQFKTAPGDSFHEGSAWALGVTQILNKRIV